MSTLTIVILTKNEETYIENAIKNAKNARTMCWLLIREVQILR